MQFTVELWAGEQVEVEVAVSEDNAIVMSLDGQWLHEDMIQWAIQYGFRQGLRDAGAAAKTDVERNALAKKRLHAIVTNTMRQGGGGGQRLSELDREIRDLAEVEIRTKTDNPANSAWVAAKRAENKCNLSELRQLMLKPYIEQHKARLTEKATANIEERKAEPMDLDLAI